MSVIEETGFHTGGKIYTQAQQMGAQPNSSTLGEN